MRLVFKGRSVRMPRTFGSCFEDVEEDDTLIVNQGVTLIIDPLSFQYLNGAEVDFKEDLQGSRFVVNNPNASVTCGCGNSFSIA